MHNIHHVWKHHHAFPALNYISQNPVSIGCQKQGAFQSCELHEDLAHSLNTWNVLGAMMGKLPMGSSNNNLTYTWKGWTSYTFTVTHTTSVIHQPTVGIQFFIDSLFFAFCYSEKMPSRN